MRLIERIVDLKAIIRTHKKSGKTIGLVPTMGYLHKGHLSLVKASMYDNDITIMSIFVNPTQFGPNEDFEKYPRDIKRDLALAESTGADVVFIPQIDEMYPSGYKTKVRVDEITGKLCGKSRPVHFEGVTTVVNKLLNIVEADKAYFGQKDAQQVVVIKRMIKDLNINTEVIVCPIIREEDGLALSSRNTYLNKNERSAATILYKSLQEANEMYAKGILDAELIKDMIVKKISSEALANIEYVEIVDFENLCDVKTVFGTTLIALAVRFGSTRLIDNIILSN